ncbi:MAG: nonstructural protein [Microviridae sp.]|nr:MAG: nonstructural protein [Microviridae sp.]
MKMQLYTIFDKQLEAYHQPFCLENDNVALRQFQNMAKSESTIATNPEDYSLWHTATFETTTGETETFEIKLLAKAHEFVIQSNET